MQSLIKALIAIPGMLVFLEKLASMVIDCIEEEKKRQRSDAVRDAIDHSKEVKDDSELEKAFDKSRPNNDS